MLWALWAEKSRCQWSHTTPSSQPRRRCLLSALVQREWIRSHSEAARPCGSETACQAGASAQWIAAVLGPRPPGGRRRRSSLRRLRGKDPLSLEPWRPRRQDVDLYPIHTRIPASLCTIRRSSSSSHLRHTVGAHLVPVVVVSMATARTGAIFIGTAASSMAVFSWNCSECAPSTARLVSALSGCTPLAWTTDTAEVAATQQLVVVAAGAAAGAAAPRKFRIRSEGLECGGILERA